MKPTTVTIALLFAGLCLSACGGCGDENNSVNNDNNPTNMGTNGEPGTNNRPVAGPGQEVVVDLGEIDLATFGAGGALPDLEDPISPEESRALISGFDWTATQPLPERSPDGRNSLWYALVYMHDHEAKQLLEQSGIYHDMLPIFAEERERWAGEVGAFRFHGDGEGIFAFAVIHGRTYNTLRELALEGELPFRGIILRDPPADATQSDGSLDYEYLAARGFRYGSAIDEPEVPAEPNAIVWAPGIPISVLRDQANLVLDAADELRRAATEVAGFFGGRAQFMIEVDVLNTDPWFDGNPEPAMRSVWQRGAGADAPAIELTGANVRLQTELLLADEPLNSRGIARIDAFQDAEYTVCIAARNDAAEVSEFLTPIIACHFAPPNGDGDQTQQVSNETFYHRVIVKDYALNLLAQFTDSRNYMRHAVGFEPRSARVLVGPFADLLGDVQEIRSTRRAFAACAGMDRLDLYQSVSQILILAEPLRIALANDVIFPGVGDNFDPEDPKESAAISRGVPTHEYGHFAMCELVRQIAPEVFGSLWSDVALRNLRGQPPEADGLWTAEGFADWFAFQVVGGVNYFGFDNDWGHRATSVYYCDPLREAPPGSGIDPRQTCMEDNVGGPGQIDPPGTISNGAFNRNVAIMATVWQDAFDGPPNYSGPQGPFPVAQDGVWTLVDPGGLRFRWAGGATDDENVALPPRAIYDIMVNFIWAPNILLTAGGMYDAIARTLRDYGHTPEDICDMFALHDPMGDCRNMVSDAALETSASIPAAPFNLEGFVTSDNRGVWNWEDGSFAATHWVWRLVGDNGDVRDGTIPFTVIPGHTEPNLGSDTEYTFTVHTANGSVRSAGESVHRLVTFAEPTTITDGVSQPGAVELTWADTGATEYVVEVELSTGERREVGRTGGTTWRVGGLDGNRFHTFRVYAVNRLGVQSEPSPPRDFATLPVTQIYVATTGSDANAGGVGDPVATLSRALELAAAQNAQAIEFAPGDYFEPTAITIDRDIRLSGSSGQPRIFVQGLQTAFRCTLDEFNNTRSTLSAVRLQPGIEVHLRDIALHADDDSISRDACVTTIDSDASSIFITNSRIGTIDGPNSDLGCAVGLQARNHNYVSFQNSRIFGYANDDSTGASDVSATAACIEGAASVQVTDSHFLPFNGWFRSDDARSVYGALFDTTNLRIVRSRFLAHGSRTGARIGAAPVAGLWSRVANNVLIDNSLFVTPRGGTNNDGLYIESVATPITLSLQHVTLQVGDNWGDTLPVTASHEGNALRIVGELDRLELVNSILTHAGGYATAGWGAALNLGEVTTTLCDFYIRGNAFAVADRAPDRGRSALVIRDLNDPEFGFISRSVNSFGTYSTSGCAAAARTENNLEMWAPIGTPNFPTALPALAVDGYPMSHTGGGRTYTAPRDALLNGGVPISTLPTPYTMIGTDVGGSARPMSTAPTIGAWTRR